MAPGGGWSGRRTRRAAAARQRRSRLPWPSATCRAVRTSSLPHSARTITPSTRPTGKVLDGFPWFTSASGFSTPALADLYGDGKNEIIDGGNQAPGRSYGVNYTEGGHLWVISPTGNAGTSSPSGGLDCEYNPDQVVQSSPAVGPFLARKALGIVVGTGTYWAGAAATDEVLAFNANCRPVFE